MPRYFAFLRAINAGPGRNVRMEVLRRAFESLGFADVSTFIASGNVIFTSPEPDTRSLEAQIELKLAEILGYEVPAFLRTYEELLSIAGYQPFPAPDLESALPVNVIFLAEPPDEALEQDILGWNSPANQIKVRGREIYWLRRVVGPGAEPQGVPLEKVLGKRMTMRELRTIIRLVELYSPSSSA